MIEVTLVTEAYNLTEGMSYGSFEKATACLLDKVENSENTELILLDPSVDGISYHNRIRSVANSSLVQILRMPGASYDVLKNLAAKQARGDFIVYLDGDCLPEQSDWLENLLAPLRSGVAEASCGVTRYLGNSTLIETCSILDFGFLLDVEDGEPVGCYASNNAAFTTRSRREVQPVGAMRCNCFQHAQNLLHIGRPIVLAKSAPVYHEFPDLRKERYRRGYDLVAAVWSNENSPDGNWLEHSESSYEQEIIDFNIRLDHKRLDTYASLYGLSDKKINAIRRLIPRLRRLDKYGIRAALKVGSLTGATESAKIKRLAHQDQSKSATVRSENACPL